MDKYFIPHFTGHVIIYPCYFVRKCVFVVCMLLLASLAPLSVRTFATTMVIKVGLISIQYGNLVG